MNENVKKALANAEAAMTDFIEARIAYNDANEAARHAQHLATLARERFVKAQGALDFAQRSVLSIIEKEIPVP